MCTHLRVLIPLQIDDDVDVLVALALEFQLAELLPAGRLGLLPLDLGEVVGLQALGAVEVDRDGGEVVREQLGLRRWLLRLRACAVLVHGVGVLFVFLLVL